MTSQFEYLSVFDAQDTKKLGAIIQQCFGSSPENWERYHKRIGIENFRLLRQEGHISAGLAIYHMGQCYGGQIVPMAGIAAVGVAPEYRGKGAAYEILTQTIQELYRQSVPISVLYPATQVLYRKVGYEQAGSYCRWELPLSNIPIQARSMTIRRVSTDNYSIFESIYTRQAQINNGNLARHQAIWQHLLESEKEQAVYAYLIGSESEPEGYIIFTQERNEQELAIAIRDWAILTAEAAKCLWTFLGNHRSQTQKVSWQGSLSNPFLLLLPEQTAKIVWQMIWMMRIIDVSLALSKRGYPTGIEAELELEIRDNLLEANNGNFSLQVSGGRGEVRPGGKGTFQIDIRGLAPFYTGFLSPRQLQQLGYLKATPKALETATLLFSGDRPWMADFF
ncbi:GNAT family N-acetyltransferase [Candidatus Gracilibacteria bacterium]|nr:GNAT family N-acetyltransferase [Candidatus Gracilibacteria bacterium]NJM88057.1 GNAT family N-acetyltransferase [Hydrococcus sp. RU_2_2]NJP19503.1 GNAT family N-acetyltransferase [Hydrococcus sp. CRU_1_1]